MESITRKEMDVALKLLKDCHREYNASSLSKEVGLTPMGALKVLKRLEGRRIVESRWMGKAAFYRLCPEGDYAKRYLSFLLMKDAEESPQRVRRWVVELRRLEAHADTAILFGSVLSGGKHGDVDLLLVLNEQDNDAANRMISEMNMVNSKEIHAIKQTWKDLADNLKREDKVVLNAVKNGVALFGYERLTGVLLDAAR